MVTYDAAGSWFYKYIAIWHMMIMMIRVMIMMMLITMQNFEIIR